MKTKLYKFDFFYNDGSYYVGSVADNGTYGYYAGETKATSYGSYLITGTSSATSAASGSVSVSKYYDVTSNKSYTPFYTHYSQNDGNAGLGSEIDLTTGKGGVINFGSGGAYESIQVKPTVFTFDFFYNDGSYYIGSVADNGTSGYYTGETVTTSYGLYLITGTSSATSAASGTVSVSKYYDITSNKSYIPFYTHHKQSDGAGGLGSETDWTLGKAGFISFGSAGAYETKQGGTSIYTFKFTYADGSYYNGTVSDSGNYGYVSGQTKTATGGTYSITGTSGYTTTASGTVTVSSYYDATSAKSYTPTSNGAADGTTGLGSESDYTSGAKGAVAFGVGGTYEAKQGATLYTFKFTYADGSYYSGSVADYGGYGYYSGKTISTSYGNYTITGTSGYSTQANGTVNVSTYYDKTTSTSYSPYTGASDGASGLGSEYDRTYSSDNGYQYFGDGGKYEAKQGSTIYKFGFLYKDGSYYTGAVCDNGKYGYYTGETINTSYGYYLIGTTAGSGGTAGNVTVTSYYDAASNQTYTPYYYSKGNIDGSSGLGNEYDYITGAKGTLGFGYGGQYEAKQS